jgi:hypothetical protein
MDTGLVWSAIGSVAGVIGVALVVWQIRLQASEHREARELRLAGERRPDGALGGFTVAVPLGRLPAEIRGRDRLLSELLRELAEGTRKSARGLRVRRKRQSGGSYVLTGMGGLDKSTLALAVTQGARQRGWQV